MRRITTRECVVLATTTAAGEAARKPIHETGQSAHVSFVCSMTVLSAQMSPPRQATTSSSNDTSSQPSSQLPAPSSQLPAPSSQLPAPSSQLPAPSSQLPAPSSQLPAPSSQLPAIAYGLQATGCFYSVLKYAFARSSSGNSFSSPWNAAECTHRRPFFCFTGCFRCNIS
jgi:hypothetical protein